MRLGPEWLRDSAQESPSAAPGDPALSPVSRLGLLLVALAAVAAALSAVRMLSGGSTAPLRVAGDLGAVALFAIAGTSHLVTDARRRRHRLQEDLRRSRRRLAEHGADVSRLRALLDISRVVGRQEDVEAVLGAVSRAVAESLGYGTVVITLHRPACDDFVVTSVHGNADARAELLGQATGWDVWAPLFDDRFRRHGAYFVPAGEVDWTAHGLPTFVPDGPASREPDAWRAEDALFVVLPGSEGDLLGVLSVDEPVGGQRPSARDLEVLTAVAGHAGLAIEKAQQDIEARGARRGLGRLLDVSAHLHEVGDPDALAELVCRGIRDALGFARVVLLLREPGAERLVAHGDAADATFPGMPLTVGEATELMERATPLEGCHLLGRAATPHLPGDLPRGPRRPWTEHRLLVALHDRTGAMTGLLWVDEPDDGLLPDLERAQALRMFANQAATALEAARRDSELRDSETLKAAILESTFDAVVSFDARSRIVSFNPAAERMLGFSAQEALGRDVVELIGAPSVREEHLGHLREAIAAPGASRVSETLVADREGREFPAEVTLGDATVGGERVFTAFIRDISDRVAGERALRAERDRAQQLLDVAQTMIVVLDREGVVELVNRKACEVLGYREDELLGRDWFDMVSPPDTRQRDRAAYAAIVGGEQSTDEWTEAVVQTKSSARRRLVWHDTLLYDDGGALTGMLSSGHDVTEQRRGEERIAYLAFHDELTGLPNRAQLRHHLEVALERSRRAGTNVALLYLDLDGFKVVNDGLGHTAGDQLLRAVAVRLARITRAGDVLARAGGDEFLLLLSDLEGDPREAASEVARALLESLGDGFDVSGAEVQVTASIGIGFAPLDAASDEELLTCADVAMYEAKASGRGRWAFYESGREDARLRLATVTRLRQAVARRELELHYQPVVSLPAREIIGAEALIRWRGADGELVAPGDFIPLAEETGLIELIGQWVIEESCRQAAEWACAGHDLDLAFNVSPRQLLGADLAGAIRAATAEHGVDPRRLTAEITETAIMRRGDGAVRVLEDLHRVGLRLAIDDFGAGYSSLSRLRALPFDTLKIDRSFLMRAPTDAHAAQIVRSIIGLAHGLGMAAVAEGVESEEHVDFLLASGCARAQGYHFGRPVPAAELTALLEARRLPRAA